MTQARFLIKYEKKMKKIDFFHQKVGLTLP